MKLTASQMVKKYGTRVKVTNPCCIVRKDSIIYVKDTGNGFFLITATVNGGRVFSSYPMSLFLKREDFEILP